MSFLKGSLVILASMFLTASSFAAGGSDGSSGPGGSSGGGTAGSAIPLQADGVVTTKQIEGIKKACNIEFAFKELSLAYGKDIHEMANNCKNPSITAYELVGGYHFEVFCPMPRAEYDFEMTEEQSAIRFDSTIGWVPGGGAQTEYESADLKSRIPLHIPRFSYDVGGATNVVYDRFKNVVSQDFTATKLQILNGEDPSVGGHLVNLSSHVDTGMVIDMRPLRDCLLKGVQALNGTN